MNYKELEARLPPNPFLPQLRIKATSRLSFKEFNEQDAEGFRSPRRYLLDQSPYTKLFLDSDAVQIVHALSDCAKSLLLYVIYNLKPGRDYVILSSADYAQASNTKSRTTIAKAKAELARLCFISPTSIRTVYFINPAYFFTGSRPNKYPLNTHINYKHEDS